MYKVIELDENTVPWERQPGESAQMYARFERYLAMGPKRSLVELASQMDAPYGSVRQWSSVGRWAERVGCYQSHVFQMAMRGGSAAVLRTAVMVQDGMERAVRNLVPMLPDAAVGRKVSASRATELFLMASRESREWATSGVFPQDTVVGRRGQVAALLESEAGRELGEAMEELFRTVPGAREAFIGAVERRDRRALEQGEA
ncbi:hypothetical protein I5Q34_00480 [Streptomyces sp. AV19]|uniref:hypothetical protein n=1 Tax=Streptomyces sp. AV19 TaxID=2793068 RepID=UPI0018FE29CD|nr:hypothetical protein [Streptomyces sp. AV19]MBH1932784.1 hypothetical protein [Streptomyces sp. AV19]MDG4531455.1 hypothetical protein [Streptomyces sp. AV19]